MDKSAFLSLARMCKAWLPSSLSVALTSAPKRISNRMISRELLDTGDCFNNHKIGVLPSLSVELGKAPQVNRRKIALISPEIAQ